MLMNAELTLTTAMPTPLARIQWAASAVRVTLVTTAMELTAPVRGHFTALLSTRPLSQA